MATIRVRHKHGKPVYNVQVRLAGFPSRTASFPNRRMAERWGATVEAEMIEGRHFRSVESRRRTLGEAVDRYLLEEAPKKRDHTRVACLRWWKRKIGHLKLADISSAVIVEHRGILEREPYTAIRRGKAVNEATEYQRKPGTVNRYLAYLSHVFTIARREWHWITHNPFDGVSHLQEDKGVIRFLTDEERERLLTETAKDPQLHTLVVLALATAGRAGELLKLTWADIELTEGRAILRHTKNNEPRSVWLHGEALRLLCEHKTRGLHAERVFISERGEVYDYDTLFREACQRAQVSNFRFHDLRHSAATYLARMGATEQQLKAIGGWKSGVVSRYVHLAAADARGVLERMHDKILGADK